MKALSEYFHGSMFAIGVEFGPSPSWPGIQGLGGVPILIREFTNGQATSETTLTHMHLDELSSSLFSVPAGYETPQRSTGLR